MQAHPFIQPDYWLSHTGYMREVLPQSEVYVYELDGKILGFIGIQEQYIAGLFIDQHHQSQGIGTSLIEFIKQKHLTLTLTVYKKNLRALQFYQRHNFVTVEERIDTINNEAELLLRWNGACPISLKLHPRRATGLRHRSLEMPPRLRGLWQVPHPERSGCRNAVCRLHRRKAELYGYYPRDSEPFAEVVFTSSRSS